MLRRINVIILVVFVLYFAFSPGPVLSAPRADAITPALEGELNTWTNAASDPNGNETVATNGWYTNGAGASMAAVTSPYAGTYAMELTSGGAASTYLQYGFTIPADKWYYYNLYAKDSTGNTGLLRGWQNLFPPGLSGAYYLTTSYANYIVTGRSSSTTIYVRLFNETNGNKSLIDNLSVRTITTSSLFGALQLMSNSATVAANWSTNLTLTQSGVVSALDNPTAPANFVIGYYDRGNAKAVLDKCVNGVYTNLINTSTTYSAGARVEIRRVNDTFKLYYNGSQIGTDQTITSMGNYYGVFSTYAGNTYTGLTFTDTATPTPTQTNTYTPTNTLTLTPPHTATFTHTPTETRTPTETYTPTITLTPTITFTPTITPLGDLQIIEFSYELTAGDFFQIIATIVILMLLMIQIFLLVLRPGADK